MMNSVAEVFGNLVLGVIMTGMGSDGAEGMNAIHRRGGFTIGQDESTCTVYGMPRACAELGILTRVVPFQIPSADPLRYTLPQAGMRPFFLISFSNITAVQQFPDRSQQHFAGKRFP